MLTIKQSFPGFEKVWTGIAYVEARANNSQGIIDSVEAGDLQFNSGPNEQTIYVMNENGATVARYVLSGGTLLPDPLDRPKGAIIG